jgi:hypothetical protein
VALYNKYTWALTLRVCTANCVIGGGVLGSGCVQEEIRFLLSPELIASLLFTERLGDLEIVLITGFFFKYYISTFTFVVPHHKHRTLQQIQSPCYYYVYIILYYDCLISNYPLLLSLHIQLSCIVFIMFISSYIIFTGSERFSKYKGYANDFEFDGDFFDNADNEVVGSADAGTHALSAAEFRRKTTIVAMDALHFRNKMCTYASQFRAKAMRRELDKAFVAFQPRDTAGDGGDGSGVCVGVAAPWIATGNWGCGAFGGDPILKAVIQIAAAAEAGRSLKYLTFGDEQLGKHIGELLAVLSDGDDGEGCTVGQLWLALQQFRLSREWRAAPEGGEELRSFLLRFQWRNMRQGLMFGQGSGGCLGGWVGGSSAVVSSAHGRDTREAEGSVVVSDDGEDVGGKRARGDDIVIIATSGGRVESSPESRNKEERATGEQEAASAKRICASP